MTGVLRVVGEAAPEVYPLRLGQTATRLDRMQIHVHRLIGSAWLSRSTHEERGAALSLWAHCCATQDPAGTLPDDDRELARLAEFGIDVEGWRRCRAGALHGWRRVRVLTATGEPGPLRLAHPLMTEVAASMVETLQKGALAKADDLARKRRGRLREQMGKVGAKRMAEHWESVEAVMAWLEARGLNFAAANVREACEAVSAKAL